MINIEPPNLHEYYGALIMTPQDPTKCYVTECSSNDIKTEGIINTCNTCNYQWTSPAMIYMWPRILNNGIQLIDNPPTNENIEMFIAKYNYKVRFWKFVDYSEIPKDRAFRDAMKCDADGFGYHIDAAKFVAIRNFRNARVAALDELDKQQLIALGANDTSKVQEIEQQKQLLRDKPELLTEQFKNVTTIDEIKELLK